jgi:hypothetical protein
MPTIALKDKSHELVGFLLVSGEEPLSPTAGRDCIFMVPPLPGSSPAQEFLVERKHQEFSLAITDDAAGLRLSASLGPGEVFVAHLPGGGMGSWTVTHQNGRIEGQCELAKR